MLHVPDMSVATLQQLRANVSKAERVATNMLDTALKNAAHGSALPAHMCDVRKGREGRDGREERAKEMHWREEQRRYVDAKRAERVRARHSSRERSRDARGIEGHDGRSSSRRNPEERRSMSDFRVERSRDRRSDRGDRSPYTRSEPKERYERRGERSRHTRGTDEREHAAFIRAEPEERARAARAQTAPVPREVTRCASASDVAPQPKRASRRVVMRADTARRVVHEHDAPQPVVRVQLTPASDIRAGAGAVADTADKADKGIRTRGRRGGDLSRKRARDRENRAQNDGGDD